MKYTFFLVAALWFCTDVTANNISLSNVQRAGFDATSKWALVEFDLSWENSWRTSVGPANWDAAWVFIKFRVGSVDRQMTASSSNDTVTVISTAGLRVGMPVYKNSGTGAFAANTVIISIANDSQFVVSETPTTVLNGATITCVRIWEHAYLDTTDANHVAPNGSTIAVPNDSTGAFIYRSKNGYGDFNLTDVRLRWKYGSNGLDLDSVDIQVFAIEMVYVPQGSFYVGSGGTESGSFTDGSWTSGATIPYQVASEGALGIDNASGKLWGISSSGTTTIGNATGDSEATLAASYPKGYAAFYCMKYELSQGQYRDFLNSLTYKQQDSRTATAPSNSAGTGALTSTNLNRNGIDVQTSGVGATYVPATYACNLDGDGTYDESDDGEWIACNFLSWMDGCAYMDWAGLRPMTELEYEKACRGDQAPVANEYAWGTSTIASTAYTLSNTSAADEGIATNYSTTNGNASYNTTDGSINGPLRVGIFSSHGSNSGRITAGATYYGIMEMSGNLWERAVSVGSTVGRAFAGVHGNGRLSANGHADQTSWPGLTSSEVTGVSGSGYRGGNLDNAATVSRLSDRIHAVNETTDRAFRNGFRGVRTAAH